MIGVLCSDGKRHEYASNLRPALLSAGHNGPPMLFFSSADCDSKTGLVSGIMVERSGLTEMQAEIPEIVLNLSVQNRKAGRANLKALRTAPSIALINPANRLNQWTVLQMLASSPRYSAHQLPVQLKDQREVYADIIRPKNLLLMPTRSTSPVHICYLSAVNAALLNSREQSEWLDKMMLQISFHERWLITPVPELLCSAKRPLVARTYMQRGGSGLWTVIGINQFSGPPHAGDSTGLLSKLALHMVNTLADYVPSLGIAFIDFVFSVQGNPFAIHAGGWDYRLLRATGLHPKLLDNLFSYASSLLLRREVEPLVD